MLKQVAYLMVLILLACEIPEQIYEDPLDLDYNAGLGIYPPALIFSPDQVTVNSG